MVIMEFTHFKQELMQIQDALQAFAHSIMFSHQDAEDLVQDTNYRMLRKWYMYTESERGLMPWAFQIMYRLAIDTWRSRQHDYVGLPYDKACNNTPPDVQMSMRQLRRCITVLPLKYALPLVLYVNGYKYDEVARMFGVSINTVRTHIYRARQRLQPLKKHYTPCHTHQ